MKTETGSQFTKSKDIEEANHYRWVGDKFKKHGNLLCEVCLGH